MSPKWRLTMCLVSHSLVGPFLRCKRYTAACSKPADIALVRLSPLVTHEASETHTVCFTNLATWQASKMM
ncbi:hypothetical protein Y032_0022g548 [Ancylostoma ceylanicum]|uniref:Uncharacterized protein n=1 Tax=Ancylostoma ceylanicum TaxID=53326 RepID=A0A016UYL0_9BILA|nr:hypothetical protein Y032_0022g548 [Ancylostoma ceylanicum]